MEILPLSNAASGELTAADTILTVACTMSADGFNRSELAVAVWLEDTETFRIPHSIMSHPDTAKVYNYLHGKRGLVAKGYLIALGKGWYRASPELLRRYQMMTEDVK